MLKSSLLFTLPLLFCSCAAKDEPNVVQPTVQPTVHPEAYPEPIKQEPAKVLTLEAAVASVQLQEDCPDAPAPTPAAPAKRAPAPPGDRPAASQPPGSGSSYRPPCVQSRLQITFTRASQAQPVSIAEIRLLSEEGKVLSTIKSRAPSIWTDNGYTPWDEVVDVGEDTQASYKIAPPAWGAVETALGKGSYGAAFVMEVDINSQGKTKTIRSNSFVRSQPMAPPPT